MNDRIEAISEQTTKELFENTPSFLITNEMWKKKFAELIVRECINVVIDVLPDIVPESKDGIHPVWHIKEHFGVVE